MSTACLFAACLFAACLFSNVATRPAAAAPPENLPDELTDHMGILNNECVTAITQIQDRLVAQKGLQLFVVTVDDFDGIPAQSWIQQSAAMSGLGEQDMAVAVATDTKEMAVLVPEGTRLDRRSVDLAESQAREHLTA